jgi:hypothetical protein
MLSTALELAGLACIVAAVYHAFGLAPALGAAGVALIYVSYAISQPTAKRLVRVRVPAEALTRADLDAEPLTNGNLAERG